MLAVARIEADGQQLGTAFAVSGDRALTAFHCVGDRHTGEIEHGRVELHFGAAGPVTGRFVDGDGRLDFAVLGLERPLPDGVEPIPLVRRAVPNEEYRALGHPAVAEEVGQWAVSGHVTNPDARLPGDVPAIQLVCREAAAGLELPGLSGGPVLVGTPEAAVGLVRWNLEDSSGLALGGSFFAAPCEEMVARVAELGAAVVERRAGPPPRDADSFAAWAAGEFAVQMAGAERTSVEEAERHYVEVLVRTAGNDGATPEEGPLSAFAVKPRARLLVVGEGGAGKTTMLLRLTWMAADHARGTPPGGGPFFARLNLVEAGGGRTFESLLALLGEPAGLSVEQMHDAWLKGEGELLFLLDGLNEVADDVQPAIATALRRLLGERRHRYVITSRPTGAADGLASDVPDLARADVVRLAEDKVRDYLASHGVEPLYDDLGEELRGLAGNPFMLWALVQACSGLGPAELPSNIGGLYRQFVDEYVFGRREPAKRPPPTTYDYAGAKRPALAAIALGMTEAGQTRVPIDTELEDRVVDALEQAERRARRRRKVVPEDWDVEDFLVEALHNGILERRGDTVGFMHESVQEYFSALALKDEPVEDVVERLPELVWRFVPDDVGSNGFEPTPLCQVVVMLAGVADDATPLVRALQGRNPLLAARCLGAASVADPVARQELVDAWAGLIGRRDERYAVIGCRCLAAARATEPAATEALLVASADLSRYKAHSAAYDALAETRAPAATRPLLERALEASDAGGAMRVVAPMLDVELTLQLLKEWRAADDEQHRRPVERVMASVGVDAMQCLLTAAAARADETGDAETAAAARTASDSVAAWRERGQNSLELPRDLMTTAEEIRHKAREVRELQRARSEERFQGATTEELVDALADPALYMRIAAATRLSKRADPAVAPALVAAVLREPGRYEAGRLADALSSLAPQPDLAGELAKMLERFEPAAKLEGSLPPPSTEPDEVRGMLERAGVHMGPDASVRATGHDWIVGEGGLMRLALVEHGAGAAVFDVERRARAAQALVALDPGQALERLAGVVAGRPEEPAASVDPSLAAVEQSNLGVAAVTALSAVGDPRLLPLLVEGLRSATASGSLELIVPLIAALSAAGAPEAARPILDVLLTPPQARERWSPGTAWWDVAEIHAALEHVADRPTVLGWLQEEMRNRSPDVRLTAIEEYARWKGEPDALADLAVGDPEARVRAAAAQALRWYPGTAPVTLLAARLQSAEPGVRRAGAEALVHVRDESAVAPLRAAFDDPDPEVRLAAAAATAALAEGDAFGAATAVIARDAMACPETGAAAVAALLTADEAVGAQLPPEVLRRVALDGRFASEARDAAWFALEDMNASPAAGALEAIEQDRFEAALGAIDALLAEATGDGETVWERWLLWPRGVARAGLGRFDEAIEDMTRYPWRDPDQRAELAGMLARAGRRDETAREVEALLADAEPEHAVALLNAGWAAYEAGELDVALAASERAATADAADGLMAALNVALIHAAAGRDGDARAAYEQAVQRARGIEPAEAEQVLAAGRTDLDELGERGTADAASVAACRAMLRL